MSGKRSRNGVKVLIIGIILICLILGYYYYLSNNAKKEDQEEKVVVTAVQDVLMRNLDTNYPPTPREVIKYYGQITQCFYNETYTEEELLSLALRIQELYDEELIAAKTQEQYINDLKWDIEEFKEEGLVVSSFSMSSSTDVEEFKRNGFSWARLYCTFSLRKGTQLSSTEEVFLLRRDGDGHWKIYGWDLVK